MITSSEFLRPLVRLGGLLFLDMSVLRGRRRAENSQTPFFGAALPDRPGSCAFGLVMRPTKMS